VGQTVSVGFWGICPAVKYLRSTNSAVVVLVPSPQIQCQLADTSVTKRSMLDGWCFFNLFFLFFVGPKPFFLLLLLDLTVKPFSVKVMLRPKLYSSKYILH